MPDIDDTAVGTPFKGFDNKHVLFSGTTGSGKTALFTLMINKNLFEIPDQIYWIDSGHTQEQFKNFHKSVLAVRALKDGSTKDLSSIRVHFVPKENVTLLINSELKNQDKKLVVFEDTTSYDSKVQKDVFNYISVAKNTNAQVVLFKHMSSKDKVYYQYFGYYVLCRPNYRDYNSIINGRSNLNTPVFSIEKVLVKLPEKYRSIIYVQETQKEYFAYGRLGEITEAHEINRDERNQSASSALDNKQSANAANLLSSLLTSK